MMSPQPRQVSNPQSRKKQSAAHPAGAPPADAPPGQFLPPLKAHPRLAVITGVILLAWLIVLIVLRLTTVHRSPEPTPLPMQTSTQT
jgi:hypothetical protein